MFIRSLITGLATSLMLVSNVAAASQPTEYPALLVEVTNTSHLCQRFDAVGEEMRRPTVDHPGSQSGGLIKVPPYLQRDAAPGATVTFEGLNGQYAMLWASSHETANCTSKMTGHGYTYDGKIQRAKFLFDGSAFHFVKNL